MPRSEARWKGLGWRMLSVRQPWAWAIVNGLKDVENRTWSTNYRGPLVIHAGKQSDEDYLGACDLVELCSGISAPPRDSIGFGGVVGIVDLLGVNRVKDSPWCFEGQEFWRLENAKPWPLIPWKGAQGLILLSEDDCHDLCVRLEAAGCAL